MSDVESVHQLLNGPLVRWATSFLGEDDSPPLTYDVLLDGLFLQDIMLQIHPSLEHRGLTRNPGDKTTRLRNLAIVLRNIKQFFEDVLDHVVVARLPDVARMASEPARAVAEMSRLLLLLLGCAVQCHCRQQVIDRIKAMDYNTQHTIVQCIQQVTDDPNTVITPEWSEAAVADSCQEAVQLLLRQVKQLAQERDTLSLRLVELLLQQHVLDRECPSVYYTSVPLASAGTCLEQAGTSESDADTLTVSGAATVQTACSSASSSPSRHLQLELADCKAKLRKAKQELDEKTEQLLEAKDELELGKASLTRLRTESLELMQDARAAKAYRDELDVMQERASRVDKLELEVQRYRDRMSDVEFYKNRVDELREDNRILTETKEMLESQLQSARKRSDQVVQLETSIIRYQQQLKDLSVERELDRNKIQDLLEENAQLQITSKNTLTESASLVAELDSLRSIHKEGSSGHSSLSDQLNSDAHGRVLRLELENQRLQATLESLKESNQKLGQLQLLNDQQKTHCDQLEREKQQLHELVESLRMRKAKDNETMDSRKLADEDSPETSSTKQLQQLAERLRDSSDRLQLLEQQKAAADRETEQLRQALLEARASCSEQQRHLGEHDKLERQCDSLAQLVDTMKQQLAELDSVRRDSGQLRLSLSAAQQQRDTAANQLQAVEHDHSQLQQLVHSLRDQELQLELQLSALQNDKQQLVKAGDSCRQRLQQLERDNHELETENHKFVRNNEALKLSCRRLNQLERENTELEAATHLLTRERQSADKEATRLRLALEACEASVDQLTAQLTAVERDKRQLLKDQQLWQAESEKTRTLEQDYANIVQETKLDKKTLLTLREQLVQEKIRSQQLSDELERLNDELKKVGIDHQKLTALDYREGESRFKALETMMEDALKKNTEVKDQKIANLENKLKLANDKYQAARCELTSLRTDLEQLQQQQESGSVAGDQQLQRELTTAQTRAAELERRNNHLMLERDSVATERDTLLEQWQSLRASVAHAQTEVAQTTRHSVELQARLAAVQVENTALQSRTDTMAGQMAAVQVQLTSAAAEKEQLLRAQDESRVSQEQLVADHETLQQLHEQLTSEYEQLQLEKHQLKAANKTAKLDLKNLQEQYSVVSEGQDDLVRIKNSLEEERMTLRSDSRMLQNLKDEHGRLKDDFRNLFSSNDKLKSDYKSLQADYKTLKSDNNTLKLKQTAVNGEIANGRDQINSLEVEISKLNNKCEMLSQLNTALEEDRRSLMGQVTVLLGQYHDLLSTTLVEKDQYHEEEKVLADKVHELRRQKEKLEEKIMDQYRRMDNYTTKNRRGFGANLVRRVKRAGHDLIGRVPRSRSRGRSMDSGVGGGATTLATGGATTTDSHDSTSLGSGGSTANDSVEGDVGHRAAAAAAASTVGDSSTAKTDSAASRVNGARRQRRTDIERRHLGKMSAISSPLAKSMPGFECTSTPTLSAQRRPRSMMLTGLDSDTGSSDRYRSCVSIDEPALSAPPAAAPLQTCRSVYSDKMSDHGFSLSSIGDSNFYCDDDDTSPTGDISHATFNSYSGEGASSTSPVTSASFSHTDAGDKYREVHTADIVSLKHGSSQHVSSAPNDNNFYQSLISVSSGCQAAASSSDSASGSVCSLTANATDHTTTIAIRCGDNAPPTSTNTTPSNNKAPPTSNHATPSNNKAPPTSNNATPIDNNAPPTSFITINGQSPPSPRRYAVDSPLPPSLPPRTSDSNRTPPLPARALSIRRSSRTLPSPASIGSAVAVDISDAASTPKLRRRPSVPPRQAPPPATSPALILGDSDITLQKEMTAAKNSMWYEYGCV